MFAQAPAETDAMPGERMPGERTDPVSASSRAEALAPDADSRPWRIGARSCSGDSRPWRIGVRQRSGDSRPWRIAALVLAVALLAGACSDSEPSVSASLNQGSLAEVATTQPLIAPTATTVPDAEPIPSPIPSPTPEQVAQPAPTQPDPTAQASTEPTAAPTEEPTAAETTEPTPAATEEPTAAETPAAGGAIALADDEFEVINAKTGTAQSITSLAPTGPVLLWFWAPH